MLVRGCLVRPVYHNFKTRLRIPLVITTDLVEDHSQRSSFQAAPLVEAQWLKSQLTAVTVAQQCLAMVSPPDVRDTKPY